MTQGLTEQNEATIEDIQQSENILNAKTHKGDTRSEQIWTRYNWYALFRKSDAKDAVQIYVQSAMYTYVQNIQGPTVTAQTKLLSFIFTGHPFNEIDLTASTQKQRETSESKEFEFRSIEDMFLQGQTLQMSSFTFKSRHTKA